MSKNICTGVLQVTKQKNLIYFRRKKIEKDWCSFVLDLRPESRWCQNAICWSNNWRNQNTWCFSVVWRRDLDKVSGTRRKKLPKVCVAALYITPGNFCGYTYPLSSIWGLYIEKIMRNSTIRPPSCILFHNLETVWVTSARDFDQRCFYYVSCRCQSRPRAMYKRERVYQMSRFVFSYSNWNVETVFDLYLLMDPLKDFL